jgi:hypothetical protein
MIRMCVIIICLCLPVYANDIYVSQANSVSINEEKIVQDNTDDKTTEEVAKDENFEKKFTGSTYSQPEEGSTFDKSFVPVGSAQYCSVLAGC